MSSLRPDATKFVISDTLHISTTTTKYYKTRCHLKYLKIVTMLPLANYSFFKGLDCLGSDISFAGQDLWRLCVLFFVQVEATSSFEHASMMLEYGWNATLIVAFMSAGNICYNSQTRQTGRQQNNFYNNFNGFFGVAIPLNKGILRHFLISLDTERVNFCTYHFKLY